MQQLHRPTCSFIAPWTAPIPHLAETAGQIPCHALRLEPAQYSMFAAIGQHCVCTETLQNHIGTGQPS